MGTIFIVLLPEVLEFGVTGLAEFSNNTSFIDGLAYFKEMAIGLVIMLFLIFEPQGLSHRWQQIRAYWKHYPFSY
jgi:branched-chain amino acid transport system permease protein